MKLWWSMVVVDDVTVSDPYIVGQDSLEEWFSSNQERVVIDLPDLKVFMDNRWNQMIVFWQKET